MKFTLSQRFRLEGTLYEVVGFLRRDGINYCTFREVLESGQLGESKQTLSYAYIEAAMEEGSIVIA